MSLRRRELGQHVGDDVVQQIGQTREGQPHFRAARLGREDADTVPTRTLDALPPNTRLPDTGFALEEECARPDRHVRKELIEARELRLSADERLESCWFPHRRFDGSLLLPDSTNWRAAPVPTEANVVAPVFGVVAS